MVKAEHLRRSSMIPSTTFCDLAMNVTPFNSALDGAGQQLPTWIRSESLKMTHGRSVLLVMAHGAETGSGQSPNLKLEWVL